MKVNLAHFLLISKVVNRHSNSSGNFSYLFKRNLHALKFSGVGASLLISPFLINGTITSVENYPYKGQSREVTSVITRAKINVRKRIIIIRLLTAYVNMLNLPYY